MALESIEPAPTTTRAIAVADELRRLIRSGDLPAGTRLRQVNIAERFAVSTTPVREAITALAREGLVRQDAHRGAVVFVPSSDDLVQNYEIRLVLEPLATKTATTNATPDDLDEIERLLREMRTVLGADTALFGAVLNPRFHAAIYAAARRPRLSELIHQLRDAGAAYNQLLSLKPQPRAYLEAAQADHEEIVAAMKARAPKQAADAMTRHLVNNRDQILASLEDSRDLDGAIDQARAMTAQDVDERRRR